MVRNTYNGRDKTWGFNLSPFQISSVRYSFLIPFYNFESYALKMWKLERGTLLERGGGVFCLF